MARGDMLVKNATVFSGEKEILNRPPYIGVPMTVDFTNVSTVDAATGQKIVKAGTPINGSGVPVSTTPWTGSIGILLNDVLSGYPTGAILKEAYINTTRAQASSGLTYDSKLVTALNNAGCRIAFEEPFVLGAVAEQ